MLLSTAPLRLAIVGSRRWGDPIAALLWKGRVERYVATLAPGTVVVSGGADGVDEWGVAAAKNRGLEHDVLPADWDKHGLGAGFIRNTELVASVDLVVAFVARCLKCKPGAKCKGYGFSHGTMDTVEKANTARKLWAARYQGLQADGT